MTTLAPPTSTVTLPPKSVETYKFSFDIEAQRMKFRLDEQTWLVNEFFGKWEILRAGENFRLDVRCKLLLNEDGTGYVWTPKDIDFDAYADQVPAGSLSTHWRLCANKADKAWRLRDERTGVIKSNQVKDYQGVMEVNYSPWYDRVVHEPTQQCNCIVCDSFRHIYHTGPAHIDDAGVAHFAL